MQPIDLTENNTPITPEQVETPVGCGGTCGGKCGSKKEKKCCGSKCSGCKCRCFKLVLRILISGLWFFAGYLYAKRY